MDISVRHEVPRDWLDVEAVVRDAFGGDEEARLVSRLRSHRDVLSLVAVADGTLAGHAMFSPVSIRGSDIVLPASGLAPVAVATAWQRRGVGTQLIRFGLEEVAKAGVGLVVVLGDPAYYGRFGFVAAEPLSVRCKWGGEDGAFQLLELVPGTAAMYRGMVDYLPAFDESAG